MFGTLRVTSALVVAFLSTAAVADTAVPAGARCRQEIRSVDDQADADIRDVNQLIVLLENELGDRAIASGAQNLRDHVDARLTAAKSRRSDLIDKQHDDLNVIRARCDRLRDEKQREGATSK